MDINELRGVATIFVFVAFIAICIWAWSGKRKQRFDEAANLPFADDDVPGESTGRNTQQDSKTGEQP